MRFKWDNLDAAKWEHARMWIIGVLTEFVEMTCSTAKWEIFWDLLGESSSVGCKGVSTRTPAENELWCDKWCCRTAGNELGCDQ